MIRAAAWPGAETVVYGFTGRAGGVSTGPHASLNLSHAVGDEPTAVERNWQILHSALPEETRFTRMRQVHGCAVRDADADTTELGDGDAAVTATAGLAVAVLTADCVPILLSAGRGDVVAAVHAGWRGTAADVVGETVRTIEDRFGIASELVEAIIGPAIGACCYEVGAEVVAALADVLGAGSADVVRRPAGAGPHVDLRAANAHLLRAAGVRASAIRTEGTCTRCATDRYFSHRGASDGRTGRQAAFVLRRR